MTPRTLLPHLLVLLVLADAATQTVMGWTLQRPKYDTSFQPALSDHYHRRRHHYQQQQQWVRTMPFAATHSDYSDYDDHDEEEESLEDELARLKQQMEVAKNDGDMDAFMTLMGTFLALGGAYDNEE